jgi:AraC-like DNA-binding protein
VSHPPARQNVAPGCLPRHRHAEAYAAVVIAGSYEEAGDQGRRWVGPGDVVVHQAWEAHLNRTPSAGAQVLNLAAPAGAFAAFGRVDDLDRLVRTAARDPREAADQLADGFRPAPGAIADWPDRLAEALAQADAAPLGAWAERLGVSREQLSRGFGRVFGVTPQRFRWEARTRAALADLRIGSLPLAELAVAHGFADQAHMTRSVRALSGRPPGAWRGSNGFKTPA